MPEFTNPYTAGDPVGKTAFFVGREDVLRVVMQVLRHPTQNAITLYGQRRIGKTSILQYLEAHLPENGPYQPVYFDLMHKAGLPLGEILRDLGRSIALKLNLPDTGLEKTTEKSFREIFLPGVLRTLSGPTSLVLLLDEFDVLADQQAEQQAKRQFFSYLRDLRQLDPARLQFIFVLGRNIDDLDVVAQGLFKDLPSQRVSLLNQKDADALVRLSERKGSLIWTQSAVDWVWEMASGHPYLTQALCSQVWENAYEETDLPEPVQISDVEIAVAGALERSQNMFSWLWDGLGPAEKVVAAALAGIGPQIVDEDQLGDVLAHSGVRILIGELQNAPKILEKWDILTPVDGGHRFRVELLRRWIVENKPLSRTWDELDRINPVANSLFEAALGLYQNNNLSQSEARLREALGLNPNHLRANELLAEILFAEKRFYDGLQILESLETIAPDRFRYRLRNAYFNLAKNAQSDIEKLEWYDKILHLLPEDTEATEARKKISVSDLTAEKKLLQNIFLDEYSYLSEFAPRQYLKILADVNRGRRTYWLVGYSQMGKTTLLKFVENHWKKDGNSNIYWLDHWNNPDECEKKLQECLERANTVSSMLILLEELDNLLELNVKQVVRIFVLLKKLYSDGNTIMLTTYRPMEIWENRFPQISRLVRDTFDADITVEAWDRQDLYNYLSICIREEYLDQFVELCFSISGGIPFLVKAVIETWKDFSYNEVPIYPLNTIKIKTIETLSSSFYRMWQGIPVESQAILVFNVFKNSLIHMPGLLQKDFKKLYEKILVFDTERKLLQDARILRYEHISSEFLDFSLQSYANRGGDIFLNVGTFLLRKIKEYQEHDVISFWEGRSLQTYCNLATRNSLHLNIFQEKNSQTSGMLIILLGFILIFFVFLGILRMVGGY